MPRTHDPLSAAKVLAMRVRKAKHLPRDLHALAEMFEEALAAAVAGGAGQFLITTKIGNRTYEPKVCVTVASDTESARVVDMSPEQARDVGVWLIQAAESAVSESNLVRLLDEKIGMDVNKVSMILADFRTFRAERSRIKPDHETGS